MKKTILLTTCAWATLAAAAGEIDTAAEVTALNRIERAAHIHMREMREQAIARAQEIREELNIRYKPQIDAIMAEIDGVCAEFRKRHEEMWDLDRYAISQKIHEDFKQKEEAALAPLLAELEVARAPVMEEVNRLRTERDEIEATYYENKRHYGELVDCYASLNTSMRMIALAEKIKLLLAQAEGELPRTILSTRSAIYKEMYAAEADAQKKANFQRIRLKAAMDCLKWREEELGVQLREIHEDIEGAVIAAMPGKHAMFGRIKQELLCSVISGQVDKETFIATAEAA